MTDKQKKAREKRRQELVAQSPNDEARDRRGKYLKGHSKPGPGRPKGAKIKDAIDGQYTDPPTELHYRVALEGLRDRLRCALGREPTLDDIPEFAENQQLQVWVFDMYAKSGSVEHARELLDRIAPKPSRVSLETVTRARPPMSAMGDEDSPAARDFMDRLDGDEDQPLH